MEFASLVRRHLRESAAFHRTSEQIPIELRLPPEENLAGWYQNGNEEVIVFSDVALYVHEKTGESRRLAFEEIASFETPPSKRNARGVSVLTAAGEFFIPMTGTYGANDKFADAWGFVRALHIFLSHNPQRRT